LKLFDEKGELKLEIQTSGSRIPIILGCALGADGEQIAAIAGLDPQKLFFVRHKEAGKPKVAEWVLDSDFRREVFIVFSEDTRHVIFEERGGLGVLNVASRQIVHLPTHGRFVGMAEIGETGSVLIIAENTSDTSETGTNASIIGTSDTSPSTIPVSGTPASAMAFSDMSLYLYNVHGALLYRESFQCRDVFIRSIENHFIIGCDGWLMRIDPMEE
jgi:hypothetical protein